MLAIFFYFLFAYLMGAFPTGVLVSRLWKIDIRKKGSRNIGATNVTRVIGKEAGLITFAGDFLKSFVVIYLAQEVFVFEEWVVALSCIFVLLGNAYSIFLKFIGGKGVSATFGCFFAYDSLVGSLLILIYGIGAGISQTSALGSLCALLALPVLVLWRSQGGIMPFVALFFTIFIYYRHRKNIKGLFWV